MVPRPALLAVLTAVDRGEMGCVVVMEIDWGCWVLVRGREGGVEGGFGEEKEREGERGTYVSGLVEEDPAWFETSGDGREEVVDWVIEDPGWTHVPAVDPEREGNERTI